MMRKHLSIAIALLVPLLNFAAVGYCLELTGTMSVGTKASNYNLTTMGGEGDPVIDWVVWGEGTNNSLSPSNQQAGGTAISDLTAYDPGGFPLRGLGQFSVGNTYQWSNGSPDASGSNVQAGIQIAAQSQDPGQVLGMGFSFTVTGSVSQSRRVYVWVGQHSGTTTFTASLNGATTITADLSADLGTNAFALLTYDFTPANASDVLIVQGLVTATLENSSGTIFTNNYFFAAAVGVVPEPSAYALGTIAACLIGYQARKRRTRRVAA